MVAVFIRCTVYSEMLTGFSGYFDNGTFGIFETGAYFAPHLTKAEDAEE